MAATRPAKAVPRPRAVQVGVAASARVAQVLVAMAAAEQEVGAAVSARAAPRPAVGPSEEDWATVEKE